MTMFDDEFFGKVGAHACSAEWNELLGGLSNLVKESAKKDEYKGPKAREVAGVGAAGAAGAGAGAIAHALGREGMIRRKGRIAKELAQHEAAGTTARAAEALGEGTKGVAKLPETLQKIKSKRLTLQQLEHALKSGKGKWKLPLAGAALGATAAGGALAASRDDARKKGKELAKKVKPYV